MRVSTVYSVLSRALCKKLQTYYSDGIRTHDLCNSRVVSSWQVTAVELHVILFPTELGKVVYSGILKTFPIGVYGCTVGKTKSNAIIISIKHNTYFENLYSCIIRDQCRYAALYDDPAKTTAPGELIGF